MAAVRAVGNLVERILSESGPLPAWCAEQRKLAGIVAEALDAPPRDGALVILTQAATGTGKTIALLAPLMALAALPDAAVARGLDRTSVGTRLEPFENNGEGLYCTRHSKRPECGSGVRGNLDVQAMPSRRLKSAARHRPLRPNELRGFAASRHPSPCPDA